MRVPRWKKNKRPAESGDFPLQITSLADVFTILLVFLLKSYASSAAFFQPGPGLSLPVTQKEGVAVQEALRIEVSSSGILLDGRFVVRDLESEESQKALTEAFRIARSKQDYLHSKNSEVAADGRLLLVVDRSLSYGKLQPALRAASLAGYGEYKFVVSTEGGQ